MLTQEYLKTILEYDSNTGIFTWVYSKGNKKNGDKAGTKTYDNYLAISLNRKKYQAHRLAWLYVYGTWPSNQIDHINGIRDDNRIENLRDVTFRENCLNKKMHRNGKLVGSHFIKHMGKWQARIRVNGREVCLGYYSTETESHKVYIKKLKELIHE